MSQIGVDMLGDHQSQKWTNIKLVKTPPLKFVLLQRPFATLLLHIFENTKEERHPALLLFNYKSKYPVPKTPKKVSMGAKCLVNSPEDAVLAVDGEVVAAMYH